MALSAFAAASGARNTTSSEKYERRLQKFRKKKKLLRCDPKIARPLFVCETEVKGKLFGREKNVLLVLFPDSIVLLNGAFDSSDDSDEMKVLKLLAYSEVLDVLLNDTSLVLEHVDAADRSRLASAQLLDLLTSDPQASSGSWHSSNSNSKFPPEVAAAVPADKDDSVHNGTAASTASSVVGAGSSATAVTCFSTTLLFASAASARETAAAILFYRAQSDALDAWLAQGLHSGFTCQLASVEALPIPKQAGPSSGGSATLWRAVSMAFGRTPRISSGIRSVSYIRSASGRSRAHAHGAKAMLYPWQDKKQLRWGCSVPLPQGWGALLNREAAAGHCAEEGDSLEITAEDLNSPCSLQCGPQALLITFSTPLGLAQATVTPQIARAALVDSNCRQVLAVPVPDGSKGAATLLPVVSFQLRFDRDAAAAGAAVGDSGNLQDSDAAAALQAPAGPGLRPQQPALSFVSDAYAALTVQLMCTPETSSRPAALVPLDPYSAAASAQARQPAAVKAEVAPGSSPGGSLQGQAAGRSLQAARLAMLVLVGSLLVPQLGQQPLVVLLQLLLLVAVALTDVLFAARRQPAAAAAAAQPAAAGTKGQNQAVQAAHQQANAAQPAAPQRSTSAKGAASGNLVLSPASSGTSAFAAAAAAPWDASPQADQHESPLSCGWSLVLVQGDLLATPGPFLQLQVAQLSCSDESAELRSQMTFHKVLPEEELQLPVLVSDPEPPWMTPDIKQRFINAKPTLQESLQIAEATHAWRIAQEVDSVLQRPCPCFDAVQQVLPMFVLGKSPDGNAVLCLKGSGVRAMCDAIHRPLPGRQPVTTSDLQHFTTFMNEYLFRVVAPHSLPGGCLVQVYDLAGLQMKLVMGEGLGLFQVLLGLGQYYPERLHVAMLLNAPSWFSIPYKVVSQFLHPNTRARVVVVGNPRDALQQLAHHFGGLENVPQEWGGACQLKLNEFPAHAEFVKYVTRVNAGAA